MAKKDILLTIILLLLADFILSQNTLLWEISTPKNNKTSYIYGSMHTTDGRAFEFNDSTLVVFQKCNAFAMEFTPDEKNLKKVASAMYLERGSKLRDFYSDSEYKRIEMAVKKTLKMDIALLEKMKPFFVQTMLMHRLMHSDKPYFVDQYFYNLALEKGMPTYSIEKVSEQIKAVRNFKPDDLLAFLSDSEEIYSQMEIFIEAYRQQDLAKMLYISEQDTSNLAFMDDLLTQRNKVMAKRIEKLLKKDSFFIVIGALHLPGAQGVLALLEKKGLKIRPIIAPYIGNNIN